MSIEDRVSIRMGGKEIYICEGYEVVTGLLTQPSRFSVRVGHSGIIADILKAYPPGTKFELYVDVDDGAGTKVSRRQFCGVIDARSAGGYAATAIFRGRDQLAQLIKAKADKDKAYTGTYLDLVLAVFTDAGMKDVTVFDETKADREAKTGTRFGDGSANVLQDAKKRFKKTIVHPPTIKVGEEYFQFLRQNLERAGLFIYTDASGAIILTVPDSEQKPLYQIVNKRDGDPRVPGTVVDFQFDDDTTDRYSECTVYGRGGAGLQGRTKSQNTVHDDEMEGFGFYRPFAKRDLRVSSIDEARFYADRAIVEGRRSGWSLEYTLAGHTTRALDGTRSLVWARDTMVQVRDEELGFNEAMYVENVRLVGDAERTTTVVRLMRKADLQFATGDE